MNRSEKVVKPKKKNPVVTASFLSRMSFLWLKDLFRIGMRRPIEEDDIYDTLSEHQSNFLANKFKNLWDDESNRKNPSLFRCFIRAYGLPIIGWGLLFSFVETITRVGQPLCLGGLVSYFAPNQKTISKDEAYLYALGIILCSLIPVITFHPFILYIFQIGMKMRLGCCSLLYKKALKLSKSSTFDGLNGQVINLMSNDVGKFDIALCFIHDLWKGPIESLLLGFFIYREIGISAVIGMAFMLSFIPLQAWIGKKAAYYRLKTAKRTDIRVRFMNEIIQGIQVIKMYTWEKSFANMVDKIRRKEINAIKGSAYVRATLLSFNIITRLSIFLSIVSYIYFGNVITARKVFIVASFYNILNVSMVHFWPLAITSCAEGYISTKRIQEFLLTSEKKPQQILCEKHSNIINTRDLNNANDNGNLNVNTNDVDYVGNTKIKYVNGDVSKDDMDEISELLPSRITDEDTEAKSVILKNATAKWSLREDDVNSGIMSIDLHVKPRKLCTIIGPVGSGKSTLLQVIINELDLDEGAIKINGRLSYAPQDPWLFEGSIRNNIVFIEEFEEKRYHEVIRVCALERDFELLPHADATIVGERGVSLSGGQRARVNLARAIYKKADIYLLDDPLSAVDTHVGKHIFEKCIREYLKDKICILVTHQLQYLKDVEHIVLMNSGRIDAQGSYKQLKSIKFDSILSTTTEESSNDLLLKEDREFQKITAPTNHEYIEQEEEKETQAVGSVNFNVYKAYFKSVENCLLIGFVFLLFIFAQTAMSGTDYFVSQWVNWEESIVKSEDNAIPMIMNLSNVDIDDVTVMTTTMDTNEFNLTEISFNKTGQSNTTSIRNDDDNEISLARESYIINYTILMGIVIYIYLQRTFSFFKLCLRASTQLHDRLFRGITRATMFFFNNNPSGRILNRFSKDIGSVDTILPMALIDCISFFIEIIAILTVVAVVNYWFLLPTLIMSILFYIIRIIYISTARSVKRIESLTRSPIFSHTNATLQGLSTIRAFKAENVLEKEFNAHQDLNTSAWYMYITTTRAFAFWLDIVCVLYIAAVTMSFLFLGNDILGGNVGLAITQVVNLIGMCQWGMRQTAELENQMTSVERVLEYSDLKSEPPLESLPKYRPPKGWPENGAITFNNLSLHYSEDSDFVLKELNFRIEPKEKIGIVGRTGAGKSSIIQALFRLAPIEGTIEIDKIDTKTLGLHDLRSKISIIPQDPILFSGTLRNNLDPFQEKKDEDLWNALAQVELKAVVSTFAGGLDCKMSDGGSNFSMGQRQLICLARAILRNNNILILDEATANVDPETDKLIQTTIRTKFSEFTVLTIAHRLHTVMDSNRVLVVDAGRVVEFAHPFELLQRPGGHLKKLVDETGVSTAVLLMQIAEESYKKFSKQK